MNILEYAIAKKMFGGSGGNNPTAYHLSSADELPTDAVDGSLAVVESDSMMGEWELLPQQEWHFQGNLDCVPMLYEAVVDGVSKLYSHITFINGENPELLLQSYTNEDCVYDNSDGLSFDGRIRIYECESYGQDGAEGFMLQNSRRLSGGYTLYSRQNGKWVSKGGI